MRYLTAFILLIVAVLLVVGRSSLYVIPAGQQAVITEFGKPIRAVTDAGLYVKTPFIQEVHRLEKRLLPWASEPADMPTQDKRRIYVDVWARWRIVDPMKFYKVVGTIQNGQQRLDEQVDSAVRNVIAKNKLIDAIRSTNNELEYESEELQEDWRQRGDRITTGRQKIEEEIKRLAGADLGDTYGMALEEVHIKRINYIDNVRQKVYERMRSERMRIARLLESQAEQQENLILGDTQKTLDEIEGEMKKRSAEIRGDADAAVIRVTAEAYGQAPEFYEFLRQLEAYKATLGAGTHLILSTENAFLSQLHGATEHIAE